MWYERWVYNKTDINFFISEADRRFAIENLKTDPEKSYAITYGIEQESRPRGIAEAKRILQQTHGIGEDEKILLFNGALYHHTNYDAVSVILDEINPRLESAGLKYKIIVCGKGLPEWFKELKDYQNRNIIYAGFVDDIALYFKGADIFLNPIISGGGIKTKAVEALASNCTVISTEIGALGIRQEVCGNKIQVSADNDWNAFTENLLLAFRRQDEIPDAFFSYYYWGNIAEKVVTIMKNYHA